MIRTPTDPRWVKTALEDFDTLLSDHAHCEKKAAATALSLVASYPEQDRLVGKLSLLAIEELRHFRAVHRIIRKRGGVLERDYGDPYVRELRKEMRHDSHGRMVDRLLVSGVIEARSHERLGLLGEALEDPALADFYLSLAKAEAGHADLFVGLAHDVAEESEIASRLDTFLLRESRLIAEIPLAARIH